MKHSHKIKEKMVSFLFLVFISLIPLRALGHSGMFKSHDGELHIARLASFYKSFAEGNFFPRWGANFNYRLGNPTLMFLYPLPNYLGLPFVIFGLSFIDTVKILFALGFIFSGVFMFLLLSHFFSAKGAFLGSVIYLFSPYRFVDIYVRGALPEHLFFMLMPLSLFFLVVYLKKPSRLYFLISSFLVAFLIFDHIACSLIYLPFIFIFLWIVFLKRKTNLIRTLILIVFPFITGLLFVAFYWIPVVMERKYIHINLINNQQFSLSHLVNLTKLIFPSWGYNDPRFTDGLSLQIGFVNLLVFVIFLMLFFLKKTVRTKFNLYLLIVYLISIFLMTDYSKFIWLSNNFLFSIHFPWRLLIMIVFISSFFAAIVYDGLFAKNKSEKIMDFVLIGVMFISLALTFNYQKPLSFFIKSDDFYLNDYIAFESFGETLPKWTAFTLYNGYKNYLEVIEGEAEITNVLRKSELHKYLVDVKSENVHLLENTLYFPGWNVYDNGRRITNLIEFQDPNYRGLITFRLGYGQHEILVKFENTKVREISKLISLTSISAFGILLLFGWRRIFFYEL